MKYSIGKKIDIFNIFAQNIDCGYQLEPDEAVLNEYPQSMFCIPNKKISYTSVNPSFTI